MDNNYNINTKCVQGGYTPGNGEPRQIPIIQSTTFKYDTSEDMGKLFDLEASGYFYTRLQKCLASSYFDLFYAKRANFFYNFYDFFRAQFCFFMISINP